MNIIETTASLRAHVARVRGNNERLGLVPTMGNLHDGHLALVDAARRHCDHVLATLFVNPLQFAPGEDYERYPRTFEADRDQLAAHGCDAVFVPAIGELYPEGPEHHTRVTVPRLSELHCGASRPGHFTGVTTIVCKLFNLAGPDVAFFGEKDYQQLVIIRKMAADLGMPVTIESVPIQREAGGLALSSRNSYLSQEEKQRATALYNALRETRQALAGGDRDFDVLERAGVTQLAEAGLQPDYFHICQAHTLLPPVPEDRDLVILAAAYLGGTRLIDNLSVKLPR